MSSTAQKSMKWQDMYVANKAQAQEYDQFIEMATMGHGRVLDSLCEMIEAPSEAPLNILELGSGTGLLTQRLLKRFPQAKITGIDGSQEMLAMALERLASFDGRFEARQSSFEDCSWQEVPGASFEYIVSSFSLHHMDHAAYRGFFGEMRRLLKPGGQLIVADYTLSSFPRVQSRYEEIWVETRTRQTNERLGLSLTKEYIRLDNETRKKAEGDNPAPLENLLCWLSEAGFEEVECYWKHFCYSIYGGRKL